MRLVSVEARFCPSYRPVASGMLYATLDSRDTVALLNERGVPLSPSHRAGFIDSRGDGLYIILYEII